MNLQSFEFDTSDAIPANVYNISPLLFTAYFCQFYEKTAWQSFMFLIIIYEVTKAQSLVR